MLKSNKIRAKAIRALAMTMAVVTGVVLAPVTIFAEENEEIFIEDEIEEETQDATEENLDAIIPEDVDEVPEGLNEASEEVVIEEAEDIVSVSIVRDYQGYSYELLTDGTYCLVDYDGNSTSLNLPGSFNNSSVTVIGENFLYNKAAGKNVQSVIIPDSIEIIEDNAFNGCSNLSSITWGKHKSRPNVVSAENEYTNLREIRDNAFYGCSAISVIDISVPGVTYIGSNAFAGCTGIRTIKLPETLSYIGNNAFDKCSNYDLYFAGDETQWLNIEYETTTKASHPNCNANYVYLAKVTYVNWGERNIQYYTPTSITAGSKVDVVSAYALYNFKYVSSVVINGPDEIGAYAFGNCFALSSLTIHNSVEIIGTNAFYGCDNMNNGYVYVHENSKAHVALKHLNGNSGVYFKYNFLDYSNCSCDDGDDNPGGGDIIGGGDEPVDILDANSACTFMGYSATFDGTIGLKCYYSFDSGIKNYSNAYMHFEVPDGKNGYTTKDIKVSEAEREGNYYVFRINLLPVEADSLIKSRFYLSSNDYTSVRTVSFYSYLMKVVDNHQFGSQNQPLFVAKALITYCNAAQRYFGYHYGNVDLSNYLYSEAEISKGDNIGYITYNPIIMDNDYIGCNLVLEDKVSFKLYFRGQKSFSEFTEANGIYTEYVNGITIFTIKDIKFGLSASLGSMHTMSETITVQNPSSFISISVYSYIRLACNSGNSNLAYLANSIYKLDSTCKTYKVTYDLQNP